MTCQPPHLSPCHLWNSCIVPPRVMAVWPSLQRVKDERVTCQPLYPRAILSSVACGVVTCHSWGSCIVLPRVMAVRPSLQMVKDQ
jgi:hypothetical protein